MVLRGAIRNLDLPSVGPGIFVTGTGTGVGKTVVAAITAQVMREAGNDVAVFKPVVTGLDEPGPHDHALLRMAAHSTQSDDEIAPYRYGPAVSPHLAAAQAGEEIERGRLLAATKKAAESADTLVCEGVGGLFVPLSEKYLVIDFAVDLGLPLIIATSPGLGTINHTLLTIEAARMHGLTADLVIMGPWPEQPGPMELSNRDTIASIGQVTVDTLHPIDSSDPASWI